MSGWETQIIHKGGTAQIVRTYDITCLGPLEQEVSYEEGLNVMKAHQPIGNPREIIAAAEALSEVMGLDVQIGGFVVRKERS